MGTMMAYMMFRSNHNPFDYIDNGYHIVITPDGAGGFIQTCTPTAETLEYERLEQERTDEEGCGPVLAAANYGPLLYDEDMVNRERAEAYDDGRRDPLACPCCGRAMEAWER